MHFYSNMIIHFLAHKKNTEMNQCLLLILTYYSSIMSNISGAQTTYSFRAARI